MWLQYYLSVSILYNTHKSSELLQWLVYALLNCTNNTEQYYIYINILNSPNNTPWYWMEIVNCSNIICLKHWWYTIIKHKTWVWTWFWESEKSNNQMVPSVVSCNIGAEMPSKVCIIIVEVKYYLNWQQISETQKRLCKHQHPPKNLFSIHSLSLALPKQHMLVHRILASSPVPSGLLGSLNLLGLGWGYVYLRCFWARAWQSKV